jgi:rfaE bifunctional protein kinase chain/domain
MKAGASRPVEPEFVDSFRDRRVLVVGDIMLDRYWFGAVNRISPEAPVPIINKRRSALAAGGAANVAANIASLGGIPELVGMCGVDDAGRELMAILKGQGISPEHIVTDAGRPTTVKTRIIAHNQHVVRVDEEETGWASRAIAVRVIDLVRSLLPMSDLVVISDYAKGLMSPSLLGGIFRLARDQGRRVVVDPKAHEYARYRGAYLLTPNRSEALSAAGIPAGRADGVAAAGARLLGTLRVGAVLITQGEAGMTLFERGRRPVYFPAMARTVYDVTGAGDTVVATISLALAAGAGLPVTAELANLAAGMAVEQVGTSTVTADQLRRALLNGRLSRRRRAGAAGAGARAPRLARPPKA